MSKTRRGHRAPRPRKPGPPRRAVWDKKDCRACGQPVRIGEESGLGRRLTAAVLEAEPDPQAILVRGADGYLRRDPDFALDGTRYAWHNCPVRNSPRSRPADA